MKEKIVTLKVPHHATNTQHKNFYSDKEMTFPKRIQSLQSIQSLKSVVSSIDRGGSVGNRLFKSLRKPESTTSRVFLYTENDSGKLSDRLGTLKGRF